MNIRDRIPVCPHEDRKDVSFYLITTLEKLEKMVPTFLAFTSGLRCVECNRKVGGSEKSAHLRGKAVDVVCTESQHRYELIAAAVLMGVRRIFIYATHVHIDVDEELPQGVLGLK